MLNLFNLNLLNIVAFLWLAFWALRAFKCLAVGSPHSILFIILIHFLFSGVPLILDVLFGKPEYSMFPGLYIATRDDTTSIIYCLYVSAVPVIWWWTGRGDKRLDVNIFNITIDTAPFIQRMKPALQLILFVFLISPVIAWMYSPEPQVYFNYGAAVTDPFRFESSSKYHSDAVSLTCTISLIGATGILALQKRITILLVTFLLPWISLVFWLNGKRGIVGFAIVLIGYVFWQKGYLKGRRFVWASMLAVLIMSIFSYTYQAQVRDVNTQSVDGVEFYDGIRIDYGRDAEIKMAIYAELYPDQMQILEHRGQSLIFYITQFVPRNIWPQKPLTYTQYVTSAALNSPPRLWGWGLTTSILEEAIANFSWFGMIVGPLVLSFICRVGDARKNVFISPLTVLVATLLLALEMVAFWPIFYLWLFSVILIRPAKRRKITEVIIK
jgi:oligosaccharide repeat unit polymerase